MSCPGHSDRLIHGFPALKALGFPSVPSMFDSLEVKVLFTS